MVDADVSVAGGAEELGELLAVVDAHAGYFLRPEFIAGAAAVCLMADEQRAARAQDAPNFAQSGDGVGPEVEGFKGAGLVEGGVGKGQGADVGLKDAAAPRGDGGGVGAARELDADVGVVDADGASQLEELEQGGEVGSAAAAEVEVAGVWRGVEVREAPGGEPGVAVVHA